MTIPILFALFALSFFLAVRSMKDTHVPHEVRERIKKQKVKGKIVFFKGKVKHYSSSSSSKSSF